ncbi:MAG: nitrous oxide reductase family maturation protein NosD [Chloroflexi bacterium]|nr:nitrous oxide reductase family maturation protein NosD [Chloroflexota bacterium]
MTKRHVIFSVFFCVFLWLIAFTPAHADSHQRFVVSPQGPFTTIQAALDRAQDGDQIEVRGGAYQGPLVVNKSVELNGIDYPIIDSGGDGTVVTLSAANIVLRGFDVRGSGHEYDRDHSGIAVTAPHVIVENNRLREVLFGIFVAKASDVIVRNNDITSKEEFEIGLKGDAIRVWYSPRVLIEDNHVHNARDIVVWYSKDAIIRNNLVEHGRYGAHLMYCDNVTIEGNRLRNNSVGIYTMYSNNTIIRTNDIRGQRGPSGYALGFKDADNIDVANNTLIDNRGGVFMDGAPFSPQGYARLHENIFAFNDVAIIMMPAVRGATIENNSFWENVEQVSIAGGGTLGKSTWRGNYWSDYTGYDAKGDGIGNLPYRSERYFEGMIDREPMLRMLLYSPTAQAIEFASTAFPLVRPVPKITDETPHIEPLALPTFATPSQKESNGMLVASLAILFLGAIVGTIGLKKS